MDIHHISTGRGNAAFFVFPDGTTLLVDAGEISDTHARTRSERNSRLRPDTSRTAAEWIVDYIRQFYPGPGAPRLDYALLTHFHDDHFGEWDSTRTPSASAAYVRTGITTVGDMLPIGTLIDRGWHFPVDLYSETWQKRLASDNYHIIQTLNNYKAFIRYQQRQNGLRHDTLRPGVIAQIRLLRHPEYYPDWDIRNLAANGRIWTGYGEGDYFSLFPSGNYPGENPLSTCLKLQYGRFGYFTGGDISGMNDMGEADFNSVESQLAPVVGPVDVASLNHHGNRDSHSPYFVRTLRPRVWIQQCWSSDHPGEEVLRRLTSERLYPGPRDLFTTDMLPANELVIGDRILKNYRNLHGHVVVRVAPGGDSYTIYVLDDFSPRREVMAVFGPYISRSIK